MKNQQIDIALEAQTSAELPAWFGGPGGFVVILSGLLTLFHPLYLYFHWGGDEYVDVVNDSITSIIFFFAFFLITRASKHPLLPERTKKAWTFFACAYLFYTIASVLWGYFEVITKTQPFPSWADPFYLSFYGLMLIGLLLLTPRFETFEERLKLLLDAGIVTVGSGMLLWYYLLQPIAAAGKGDHLMTVLSLAYPVCDLLLIFGFSVVIFRKPDANVNSAINLLLMAGFIFFFADILFGYQNLNGTYKSGTLIDCLYTVSGFAAILGAHCQYIGSSKHAEENTEIYKIPKFYILLPYLAIAAGGSLVLQFAFEDINNVFNQLIIIAGVLAGLVIFRQIIAIREAVKGKDALAELQERFQGIYNSSKDAIAFASFDGTLIDVNDAFTALVGYSREELLSSKTTYQELTPLEYRQMNEEYRQKAIQLDEPCEYEKEYFRKDGSRVPILVTAFRVKGNDGKTMGFAAIIRNITERKRNEAQLLHNALHDSLTNLPNRTLFIEHLRGVISRHERQISTNFAVLFLDLDRFKVINDSLGHFEGDKLLVLIARRLRRALRPGDIVARLGGDEFTILIDGFDDSEDLLPIVERIEDTLKMPFTISGREIFISASIGVALSDTSYRNPEDILRDADTAMYFAKSKGKARYQIFTKELHECASSRLILENEMRPALERGEFCLYYQPIINIQDNMIHGFEALIRWQHPKHGLIPPDEFITIAEETGFVIPLGEWILREGCRQLREWQKQDSSHSNWTISINLSSKQFQQLNLVKTVASIIEETGIAPEHLHLEVTESSLMEDIETAIGIMDHLQKLGVKISIDDFGTGYSSLSYLHLLPIDYLKIDRSFVGEMLRQKRNAKIVRIILMLAESLGIEVIAEGIENEAQLNHLKKLDCANGQGFLFSAPLSAEKVIEWTDDFSFPKPFLLNETANNHSALRSS
jgi:diguanylate cyclase (GGDEF)-like protein/PAS domain S-box-containing protein